MLNSHNIAHIPDQAHKNDLIFEVNYQGDRKEAKINEDSTLAEPADETIRATIGDKVAYIKLSDLYSFMMVAGTPKQQTDMLPITQTTMEVYEQMHIITLKQDLKKGQTVRAHCRMRVPVKIVHAIKRDLERNLMGSALIS